MNIIDAILEAALKRYVEMYDSADPSMAELGRDAWHQQCELAAVELISKISSIVLANEEQLINGEFYRE